MSDLQRFYDKLNEFGIKTDGKDINNYGSTWEITLEFPDHTKFKLSGHNDYGNPAILLEEVTDANLSQEALQ